MGNDGKKRTKTQYDEEFKRVVLEEVEETTIAAAAESWGILSLVKTHPSLTEA